MSLLQKQEVLHDSPPQYLPPIHSGSAVLGSAAFSFASSIPKSVLPDNIVVCESSAGCVNKTLFGRTYKVITTPRFTVMVSVSQEGVYTRADVSITNNSGLPLSLSPDDFRVEVVTPKPKVLLYVSPADLKDLPPSPPAEAARCSRTPDLLRHRTPARNRTDARPADTQHPTSTLSTSQPKQKSRRAGESRKGCRGTTSAGIFHRPQRSHARSRLLRARQKSPSRHCRLAHRWRCLSVPVRDEIANR